MNLRANLRLMQRYGTSPEEVARTKKDWIDRGLLSKTAEEKFKLQGHITHQGLEVAVENRKGSVRSGTDKDGKPWRTVMKAPYGYLVGTEGADGDEVDVYVGPQSDAPNAYVVHQHKDNGKGYDEDKVMLGFKSKEHATKGYLKHYNDPKFLGPISEVPVERLKELVEKGEPMKKISTSLPATNSMGAKLLRKMESGAQYVHGKLQLPAGVDPAEHLTGVNRARQLIMGHRADALKKLYEKAAPGPAKEELLKKLVDEGTNVAKTQGAIGTAGMLGSIGLSKGIEYGVGKAKDLALAGAGRAVSGKAVDDSNLTDHQKGQLTLDRMGLDKGLARSAAERLLPSAQTDKLTAEDAVSPLGALELAAVGSLAARPAAEHLLGAQTFYHGTPHADSVVAGGLDPGLGGVEGGATHAVLEKARNKAHLEHMAERAAKIHELRKAMPEPERPKFPAFEAGREARDAYYAAQDQHQLDSSKRWRLRSRSRGTAERLRYAAEMAEAPTIRVPAVGEVEVDTRNFKSNALGRTYVGSGAIGKSTALTYGQMLDPGGYQKILNPLEEVSKRHPDGKIPTMEVLRGGHQSFKNYKEWGDKNVVHGVMPHELFHSIMERDPDDIALGGSGMRTKVPVTPYSTKIPLPEGMSHPAFPATGEVRNVRSPSILPPEHLGKGTSIPMGQIFKNRSKDMLGYVKNNPGRVAKGLGIGALGAGALYFGGKPVVNAVRKLMPKKDKEKEASVDACIDELAKLGAISDDQAERALGRYESLERNAPTTGQVARYGALGAAAGPTMGAIGDVISGNPLFGGKGKRLRGLAGRAVTGAIGSGAIPLVRQQLDRRAELGTLKGYLAEHGVQKEAGLREDLLDSIPEGGGIRVRPMPHLAPDAQHRGLDVLGGLAGAVGLGTLAYAGYKLHQGSKSKEKLAFETSMYSDNMSPPNFKQRSQVPPMRVPLLHALLQGQPEEKTGSMATTPGGRLASAMKIGLPKVTAPSGPSIAQVAKPVGFGRPAAGATKTV